MKQSGVSSLFPTQEKALATKVLEGQNLILAVPTSSGKTLVAEICMLRNILDGLGKALYLVPLRSLAQEKYEEFKKYENLGITVAMSIGDYDSKGTQLAEADIVILTTERADSIIRHNPDWIHDIGIIVVDEIHLINDSSRGPTLEMVLAKMLQILPNVQVVGLSATISNADEIAGWLNAELVKSSWRPVELKEGVYYDGEIKFADRSTRSIPRKRKDEIADIICDILEEDGQVLVFVSSRKSTIAVCKKIASSIRPYLSKEKLGLLSDIAKRIISGPAIPESTKTLSRLVGMGVAFHHAGLTNQEQGIVEAGFKNDLLKVIVATPTLAAGVNLPARRAIIRDYRRFEQNRGSYPIPVLEYKQMAGRAGRPKYDKYGEAIIFAKSESEQEFLLEHYLYSETESISSKLASQEAVQTHVLSAIATEMTRNRAEIDKLIDGTFFSYQSERWEIDHHVTSALDFLEQGELIEINQEQMYATPLGQRTSRLYIHPYTAIMLRDTLVKAEELTEIGILQLVAHCPDQPLSYVTQSEMEEITAYIETNHDKFLVPVPDSWEDPEGYSRLLAEVKTAYVLQGWISETSESQLTEQYNVGMGDIHRYVRSAEWLLYSAAEIARVVGLSEHIPILQALRSRVKYGIKNELLELANLKGIGRVRARMMYSNGIKGLVDLYSIPLPDLARIPAIGTVIAASIKKQLGLDTITTSEDESTTSNDENTGSLQTLLEDF
ncbi:MAG: DEAD/DEAH box helicase [Candidatus Thorarchaeota archaeon]|nr:DEAD/DEAH box helicase [Candidatus Thorarchaeota archaeon]